MLWLTIRRPFEGRYVPDGEQVHASQHGARYGRIARPALTALSALCLAGCAHLPLLDPKGPIGEAELHVIEIAFALMLIVVVPVIIMAIWFPRRYKASDPKGDYDPTWSRSTRIDVVVWLIPALIVTALGILTWRDTHKLDPFRPIADGIRPLSVEVVSLDWKWLFIYPRQHIATVNRLVIPAHVPISFRLTSATVMSSFFIPQLGSQIYAMAGRQSRLHLLADSPGIYTGQNQQFSGAGFADMHFQVRVVPGKRFSAWVKKTRRMPERLDTARFAMLSKPGVQRTSMAFSQVTPGLFDDIVERFRSTPVGH